MSAWSSMLRLSAAIDSGNRILGRLTVWPILAAVVISAGNAVSRKFFDLSSNAFLEVQWYLFSLAFLGAAGYVLLVNEHVRIDAVSQRLPKRVRAWIDIVLFAVFVLPLTVLLGDLGFDLFWQTLQSGEMSYNAGGLPRWPAYACIPLGMATLGLQAVSELIRRGAWLRGLVPEPVLSEADLPHFMAEPGGPAS
ncbi:MAG: TRAP transporter small permease subunit [Sulfuritalea sp.]|nr:TRAP transporter small permease subunit [Sulfuritalea sp.]